MHLNEEQVQRHLDRELPEPAETSAREHLAACPDCRRRVAEAEEEMNEVQALLRRVDHPMLVIRAEAVAARARRDDTAWLRRAAGILLAVGIAGAVYAAPGSPVRGWLHAMAKRIGDRGAPSGTPVPMQRQDSRVAGIAVVPGQRLVILFTSPQAAGLAKVSLTDGSEVVVRAPLGVATFTSGVDQLVIDNRGSLASFEIEIPRAAPWVEVRVAGARLFLKAGGRITTGRPSQPQSTFILPLKPPGS
jgi:anti-sigma factor RsiW